MSKIKAFNLIIFYLILPVSNEESKHKCPRFAFPECPGGRITTLSTLPRPPSVSESSESKKLENIKIDLKLFFFSQKKLNIFE